MPWVGGYVPQRGGRGLEEGMVQHACIGQRQLGHFPRQGEDDMVIVDRQQRLRFLVQPASAGQGLAFGAVAVAARIVSDPLVATVETLFDVSAESGRAARSQVA